MASVRKNGDARSRRPPATTPEQREQQLISKAVNLAERQIEDGTASSQIITHYLKLATTREALEKEKLVEENKLLKARTESMASAKRVEELYEKAMRSMRVYSGQDDPEEFIYED